MWTEHISARSLQSVGAMALLLINIESDAIFLIESWRRDEMLCYLHVTARPLV